MKKNNFLLIALVFLSISSNKILAHEVFTIRSDMARENGFNFLGFLKHTKQGKIKSSESHYKLMYGVTSFLTLTSRLPIFLDKRAEISTTTIDPVTNNEVTTKEFEKAAGLGKIEAGIKYLFLKNYQRNIRDHVVLFGNLFFPTSMTDKGALRSTSFASSKSIDVQIGVTASHETTTFYSFGTLATRINTRSNDLRKGIEFLYSFSAGIRPQEIIHGKPDWVFLLDFDGIYMLKDSIHGKSNKDTGGHVLYFGPTFFKAQHNTMLRGGLQFPIAQHLRGNQQSFDWRGSLVFELFF